MQTLSRQVRNELKWLVSAALITTALALLLFGTTVFTGTVDLHLYDTYFVIAPWLILLPLFCLITFLLYVIKKFSSPVNKAATNWILITTAFVLVTMVVFLMYILTA